MHSTGASIMVILRRFNPGNRKHVELFCVLLVVAQEVMQSLLHLRCLGWPT